MKQLIILIIIGLLVGFGISFFNNGGLSDDGSQKLSDLTAIESFLGFVVDDPEGKCSEDRTINYYFDKNSLPKAGTVNRFDLPGLVELQAISANKCEEVLFAVREGEDMEFSEQANFSQFLINENNSCEDCLVVLETGPSIPGHISEVSTGNQYCYSGPSDTPDCQ
jgi:hypothetical protein